METSECGKEMKFSPKIYTQRISCIAVQTGQFGAVKNYQQHMDREGQFDMNTDFKL